MKTKLVKNMLAPLVLACALVAMVATTAAGQGTQGGRLQGTWEMQITLNDCAGHVIRSFPSLVEFAAGGTVVESNAGTPQALKTPGEGVWRHTTDNNYAFSFKFFTFDTQNVFTGCTIIAGETTVDSTGNANTGSATVSVYDVNGNLLVTLCADTAGTRYQL
ncbi:MAG: hypothetical protein DME33_01030 [Verrucomicrobia bacterium]|nr:MAG: hypothetical protein DME33_01030 [Verrucomicrobiota bacterium]